MNAKILLTRTARISAVLTAAALIVTGCGSNARSAADSPTPLVLAVGGHANAAGTQLVPQLQQALKQALAGGANVPVVVGGGKPRLLNVVYQHQAANSDAKAAETNANVAA